MAREIVITSVPRGVKLGRTGFQVAMQTAGLRDDVAALLEKMAGYRHLPAGSGANPVCYFHRVARTVAGPINVIGRIVDAGNDFSNRSNKLAHMLALEPAEVAALAGSQPAAALAAIEGRLATAWPGGPELRQAPFMLAGIPSPAPAVCRLWQQVTGDPGWAGVIAERALQGHPTLVIGRSSAPESCRQMLLLFQEALALIPAHQRWAITFDTTTLMPDGILWRGTYKGSPESLASQAGVLEIDLSRPQPVPANMAVGELVAVARRGPAVVPSPPIGQRTSDPSPVKVDPREPVEPVTSGGPRPPPPPGDDGADVDLSGRLPGRRSGGSGVGWIVGGSLAAVLLLAMVGIGTYIVVQAGAPERALRRFQAYADGTSDAPEPSADDLGRALRREPSKHDESAGREVKGLNELLAADEVKAGDIKDAKDLETWLQVADGLRKPAAERGTCLEPLVKKLALDGRVPGLLAELHPEPFRDFPDFKTRAADCQELVSLTGDPEPSRAGKTTAPWIWKKLLALAKADGKERDFSQAQSAVAARLAGPDVASLAALVDAVRRAAKAPPPEVNDSLAPAAPNMPPDDLAAKEQEKAFKRLHDHLQTLRSSKKTLWRDGEQLVPKIENLTADVVVGDTGDLKIAATQNPDGTHWDIKVKDQVVLRLDVKDGVTLRLQPDAPAFKEHEALLRHLPIFFKQPGKPLGGEDFVVLSQPDSVQLRNEPQATLEDLLVKAQRGEGVALPADLEKWRQANIQWTPRREVVKGPPLTLAAVAPPRNSNEWQIQFQATIGEDYTLVESITLDLASRRATYGQKSWREQALRLGKMHKRIVSPKYARILGFDRTDEHKQGMTSNDNMPYVVVALLERAMPDLTPNGAEGFLGAWSPREGPTGFRPHDRLRDWRDLIQARITTAGHPFAEWQLARFEADGNNRPEDPGSFDRPRPDEPKQGEKDFEKKKNDVKKWEADKAAHDKKKASWDEWKAKADKHLRDQASMPDVLQHFLSEKGKQASEEQQAAIHFLLEHDGLVIAKVFSQDNTQLEDLLRRVPIAALLKGTVVIDWTVKGLGHPFQVEVAEIIPAKPLSGARLAVKQSPDGEPDQAGSPATPAAAPQP